MRSIESNPKVPWAIIVGVFAIVGPALHTLSDVLEWYQHGYTATQLWLKYLAFVPMPWLLLGICLVHTPRLSALGIVGALLYGMGFVYFEHAVLYALTEDISGYADLKSRLGTLNTVYGTFMIYGALIFAWAAVHTEQFPRYPALLLALGVVVNIVLWLLSVPDTYQTMGTAVRNLGIACIGWALMFSGRRATRLP